MRATRLALPIRDVALADGETTSGLNVTVGRDVQLSVSPRAVQSPEAVAHLSAPPSAPR